MIDRRQLPNRSIRATRLSKLSCACIVGRLTKVLGAIALITLASGCVDTAPYAESSLPEDSTEAELRSQLVGGWSTEVPVAGGRIRNLWVAADALVFCSEAETPKAAVWAPTGAGDGWLEFLIVHEATINVQRIRWNDPDSFWVEHLPDVVFHRTDSVVCGPEGGQELTVHDASRAGG